MSKVGMRFDAKELERSLKRLGAAKAQEVIARAALEGAEVTADQIKRNAPDSGFARQSGKKSQNGKIYPGKLSQDVLVKSAKVDARGVLVRVVSLPFYTGFVERGTSKQPPNPYIRRAARQVRPKADDAFKAGVRRMVEEAFR